MVFTSFFTLPMISIDFPLSRLIGLKDVKESIRHTRNFIEVQPGNPETPETSDSRPSEGPEMEKNSNSNDGPPKSSGNVAAASLAMLRPAVCISPSCRAPQVE